MFHSSHIFCRIAVWKKLQYSALNSRGDSCFYKVSDLSIQIFENSCFWSKPLTALKFAKYAVFSGRYFPLSGLNVKKYSLRIQSEYRTIQTTFHIVASSNLRLFKSCQSQQQTTNTKSIWVEGKYLNHVCFRSVATSSRHFCLCAQRNLLHTNLGNVVIRWSQQNTVKLLCILF